jgi:hypothetical protein
MRVMLFAAIATISALGAAMAQPDTRWRSFGAGQLDGVRQLAEVCALNDAQTGNAFCVTIGCTTTGPMEWAINFTGAGAVPARAMVTFSVDGRAFSPIPMTLSEPGFFRFSAPVDPQDQAPLLRALRDGGSGVVFFDTTQVNPQSFTLNGSTVAIEPVLRACPVAAPAAVADPETAIRAEVARACAVAPAALPLRGEFVRREDVDGDGAADLIFDFGALDCGGMSWCGSGGCTHSVWRAEAGGGYREIFRDTVYSVSGGFLPVLAVEAHGSACGLTGAQGPCNLVFRIMPDGRLQRLD